MRRLMRNWCGGKAVAALNCWDAELFHAKAIASNKTHYFSSPLFCLNCRKRSPNKLSVQLACVQAIAQSWFCVNLKPVGTTTRNER